MNIITKQQIILLPEHDRDSSCGFTRANKIAIDKIPIIHISTKSYTPVRWKINSNFLLLYEVLCLIFGKIKVFSDDILWWPTAINHLNISGSLYDILRENEISSVTWIYSASHRNIFCKLIPGFLIDYGVVKSFVCRHKCNRCQEKTFRYKLYEITSKIIKSKYKLEIKQKKKSDVFYIHWISFFVNFYES